MYYFLNKKTESINGTDFYKIQVECFDTNDNRFSIATLYAKVTEENTDKLSYLNLHDDISNMIGFKVRNDGKVVLALI